MLDRFAVRLEEAEFEFGFFGHHVFVPLGVKDNVYIYCINAIYRPYLLLHIFHKEVCRRTVRGSKGHIYCTDVLFREVNAVDESQFVYIDRYLRLLDRLNHTEYLVLKF